MSKNKVCSHPALQIFIASLIPNLGAWIIGFALLEQIKENEESVAVKSFLDPPAWVKAFNFISIKAKI